MINAVPIERKSLEKYLNDIKIFEYSAPKRAMLHAMTPMPSYILLVLSSV